MDQVFRRVAGDGWLVLAGSNPELGGETAELMERLLEHLDLARGITAIAAPDCDPDEVNELLESFEEWLGVEAGYLELDTDLATEGWEEMGLLLLEGDDPELWVEALQGEALDRLRRALKSGKRDPRRRRCGGGLWFALSVADPARSVVTGVGLDPRSRHRRRPGGCR